MTPKLLESKFEPFFVRVVKKDSKEMIEQVKVIDVKDLKVQMDRFKEHYTKDEVEFIRDFS